MSNRHGKHKMIDVICIGCGVSFKKQRRRSKALGDRCTPCARLTLSRLSFWPSKRLREVINNEGRTDAGTDFEERLDDIKETLWTREQILMEKQIEEQSNEQQEV